MITPKDNLNLSSSKEKTDKRKQSYGKQGASTEENCRNDILLILLGGELRYRQLIGRLVESEFILQNAKIEKENAENKAKDLPLTPLLEKPKRFYSKQTVTHYLKDLFDDEFVTRNIPDNQLSSIKPPLHLTDKGREEARKQGLFNSLKQLPVPLIERVILGYKYRVFVHLWDIKDKPTRTMIRYPSHLEKSKGIGPISFVAGGQFNIPTPKELTKEEILRLPEMTSYQKNREKKLRDLKAIDDVLKGYNFSDNEILEMWLGNGWLIADVLRFRDGKSEHNQEEIEQMKHRIREQMIILRT